MQGVSVSWNRYPHTDSSELNKSKPGHGAARVQAIPALLGGVYGIRRRVTLASNDRLRSIMGGTVQDAVLAVVF